MKFPEEGGVEVPMHIKITKIDMVTIIVLVVAVGVFLAYLQDRREKMLSYEPSDYGIPDEIAGYKVLGVQTADSNPCQPDNQITVVVSYANTTQRTDAVYGALNAIDPDTLWLLVLTRSTNREQLINQMKWVHMRNKDGCAQFGVPAPLPTM